MQKSKLYREKTANTVLVVPSRARKYRKALYIFDFVLSCCGLASLLLASIMLSYASKTFFPNWVFQVLLGIGILTIILGAFGGRGATVSYRCLEEGSQNFWLITLTFLMGTLILLEILAVVWITVSYGVVSSHAVDSQEKTLSIQFEDSLKSKLKQNENAWWDFQKTYYCCGYDNNTIPAPLATGKYCTTDPTLSAQPCKTKLWNDVAKQAIPISVFVLAFLVMQISVCASSVCLACVIKAQEPIYRDM